MSTAEKGLIDRSSRYFIQVPHDLILGIKSGNAYLVYSILKTYTNQGNNFVFPKRETIAKHMGVKTTKPVDAALKVLADLGLVALIHRYRNEYNDISYAKTDEYNTQTSNGYIIYDVIHKPGPGWDDPHFEYIPHIHGRGVPKGNEPGSQKATPPGGQMDAPRVAEKGHEVYPLEVQPVEVDKSPLAPQGADDASVAGGEQSSLIDPFDEWWKYVNKKESKGDARRAFKTALKKADLQTLIDGIQRSQAQWQREQRHRSKTPHPATWLRAEAWLDEIPDAPDSQPSAGSKAGVPDYDLDRITALMKGKNNG